MSDKPVSKGGALASLPPEQQAMMLSALNKQMSKLIGKNSGYMDSLPKKVQNRIRALKKLQEDKEKIDVEFEREKMELEKKFREKYAPLYSKRTDIVNGTVEPEHVPEEEEEPRVTEVKDEKEPAKTEEKNKDEKKDEKKEEKKEETENENVTGVPNFWLQALVHHPALENLVSEKDEDVLKFLKDIKVKDVPNEVYSFALEFVFEPNEFFDETVLSKTYHVTEHPSFGAVFESAEFTKITWKSGKDVTKEKKTIQKGGNRRGGKRGGKSGGQSVTVERPTKSFFQFFSDVGVYYGLEDMDEAEEEQIESLAEYDYETAMTIREQIIPNAVLWYTGEAESPYSDEEGGFDEEGEEGEDDEEDDDEDEDKDTDYKPPANNPNGEQCKQQ